ncbi:MAG: hypothetical protein P4L83_23480 [Nevskia sp.]|nr:hypothetical protein [Nevskia sp.]
MIEVLRLRTVTCACGALAMLAASFAAHADDATASPSARAALDQAIEHEKSRRTGAIAGMVVGGLVMAGGSIASAVAETENHDNRNNGSPQRHNIWVGYAVGLGVGLPILGISGYVFADSQHQLNLLKRQRLSVSYSPETHRPVLLLTYNY